MDFFAFSPTKVKITQVTGDSGTYEGVGIVFSKLSDSHFIPLYPSYIMHNSPQTHNFKYSYQAI